MSYNAVTVGSGSHREEDTLGPDILEDWGDDNSISWSSANNATWCIGGTYKKHHGCLHLDSGSLLEESSDLHETFLPAHSAAQSQRNTQGAAAVSNRDQRHGVGRDRVPIAEIAWEGSAPRLGSTLGTARGAAEHHGSKAQRTECGTDGAARASDAAVASSHFHDINSESWSSRGSVGAAALNMCDINTASWSSRDSRSPWFNLAAVARQKALDEPHPGHSVHSGAIPHDASHPYHHDLNACSWRSRSSAALNLCEINTASWGSANSKIARLASVGHAGRGPVARSMKDLLEDFALFGGAVTAAEASSTAVSAAAASGTSCSGGAGAVAGGTSSSAGYGQAFVGGSTNGCSSACAVGHGHGHGYGYSHMNSAGSSDLDSTTAAAVNAIPVALRRLEAGSIAALQAELAKNHSSHHHHSGHHRIDALLASLSHGGCASGRLGESSTSRESTVAAIDHNPRGPAGMTSVFRFVFNVAGSKLESKDKQMVSEMFMIPMGETSVPFRVQVIAKQVHRHKHGQCFRTAGGRGRLELKCAGMPTANAEPLAFCFRIGSGERAERPRGPAIHNFLSSSVGALPPQEGEWDFRAAIDPTSANCQICLEVMPPVKASPQPSPHIAHADLPGGHLSTIAEDLPEIFI